MPKAHQQQFPQAPPLLGPLQPLATEEHAKSTVVTRALIVEVEGDGEEDGEQPGETKKSVEEVLLQPERGNRSGANRQAAHQGDRRQGGEGDAEEGVELEGEQLAHHDREVDGGAEERLVGHHLEHCSAIFICSLDIVGQLLKRHHRHGGGAAEQVAQSQVEEEGCAVVVQPAGLPDHQHRQSVAKGAWDKHGLVKLTRRS